MSKREPLLPANTTKRLPAIAVGDLIQYRYCYGPKGFAHHSQTTRTVIEVVDGGALFMVEGGFNVYAKCVITHIPMHRKQTADSNQQSAKSA